MGKPLQIRDVPDEVLNALRVRAAAEGLSLSAYVLRLVSDHAARPTVRDVLNRPRTGWSRGTRGDVLRAIQEGRHEQDVKADRIVTRRDGR